MIFQPKNLTHPKSFLIRKNTLGNLKTINEYKRYNIIATKTCFLTAKQFEAARQAIVKILKRKSCFWSYPFPHIPVSGKPIETRMGKGKGGLDFWATHLSAGQLLFQLNDNISSQQATKCFNECIKKLPFTTKIIMLH